MVAVGVMGPLIAWQWTHQRIHGDSASPRVRRSIRDLLGTTVTIAIGSAALQAGDRWFGLTSAATLLAILTAALWLVMSSLILSRWWATAFVTVPIVTMSIVAVQWIIIGLMSDMRSPDADAELMRLLGITCGFYFFALVLLLLM